MLPVSGAMQLNARGADQAAAHQLAQRSVLVVLEAGAVFFVGQEEVPEAFGLGFFADVFQRLRLSITALAHRALNIFFDGEDILVHEVGDALAQLFGLGGQRKVHFDPREV